ncbi:MAG: elongation factor G, partial [Clostridia bacterium]|nr:elongation factor G [Clostridia bacterium]
PVLGGSATTNSGIINLMKEIIKDMPSPLENSGDYTVDENGNKTAYTIKADGPCQVKVFKTIADPFVGKMNVIKVMGGTLKNGTALTNMTSEKQEKIANILLPKGKKQTQTDSLCAGDIGALSKLQYTNTGDTLSEDAKVKFAPIEFPTPMIEMAVGAVKNNEEEKVIQGLYRLLEEDSTFSLKKNVETAEMLICGMGETHIDVICKKLKSKFNVEAKLNDPKIPYRETIKKKIEAEGKHKKQSGGHGQYGHCKMRFEPCEEDFMFDSEVVGGTVPKQYIPAIEKGLRECLPKGVLAGYPVVGLKAVVYDGSYHDVDSSEMAFKIAASLAFKDGLKKASPVILEPIMSIEVIVPESYTGDIMGDMNKRRGRILGIDMVNKKQVVHAEAPQSEMFKYATDLRSMTQGRGKFTMKFERYEEAPAMIIDKIVKERAALLAAEND